MIRTHTLHLEGYADQYEVPAAIPNMQFGKEHDVLKVLMVLGEIHWAMELYPFTLRRVHIKADVSMKQWTATGHPGH